MSALLPMNLFKRNIKVPNPLPGIAVAVDSAVAPIRDRLMPGEELRAEAPNWREHERRELDDGTRIVIVPLDDAVRDRFRDAFEQVGAESLRRRFLSAVSEWSGTIERQLVDAVDGIDQVALVAAVDDKAQAPVGDVRMIRYRDAPHEADVAFTVMEDFRGRGASRVLMDALMRHRLTGIDEIVTEVASDNEAALHVLAYAGPITVGPIRAGSREVRVDICAPSTTSSR